MDTKDIVLLVQRVFGQSQTLTIPTLAIDIMGTYESAAVLCQIVYWSKRSTDDNGRIRKTYQEWQDELRLSKYQVKRATDALSEVGVITTEIKKGPGGIPNLHYTLHEDKLSELILQALHAPYPDGGKKNDHSECGDLGTDHGMTTPAPDTSEGTDPKVKNFNYRKILPIVKKLHNRDQGSFPIVKNFDYRKNLPTQMAQPEQEGALTASYNLNIEKQLACSMKAAAPSYAPYAPACQEPHTTVEDCNSRKNFPISTVFPQKSKYGLYPLSSPPHTPSLYTHSLSHTIKNSSLSEEASSSYSENTSNNYIEREMGKGVEGYRENGEEENRGSIGVEGCGGKGTEGEERTWGKGDGGKRGKATLDDPDTPCLLTDVGPPMDVHTLIARYKRHRGTPASVNKSERMALMEWLSGISESEAEVLGALEAFLADEYWRDKRFPLAAFRSQYSRYLDEYYRSNQQSEIKPYNEPEPHGSPKPPTQASQPSVGLVSRSNGHPVSCSDWLEKWNTLAPSLRVDNWSEAKDSPKLRKALADEDFVKNFEQICQKAEKLRTQRDKNGDAEDRQWPGLRWLLTTPKSGECRWWEMLNGAYDWLARPPRSKEKRKLTSAELVQEAKNLLKKQMAAKSPTAG